VCLYEINHRTQSASKTLHEDRQKHPFGLEEVAARMEAIKDRYRSGTAKISHV
jgi:hypothetical protein